MPDNVDSGGAANARSSTIDENSPDLVGEELDDGARIWRVYDRVAREEDRERISHWNRGLDNLALFAGLFAAVTTAFIIESQQDTEPDYARLTFLVLNASAAGVPFQEEPFVIDPSVRATNCLWIASLMLSLTAALIAIMGKDWIGMYVSRPVCNPRQWADIRTYRVACVERWYMSGVIAAAPVLLHISLVLFAAGLVLFVSADPFSQRVALGLALAAGGLYLVTVLSAVVFPTSPFKSPATQAARGFLLLLLARLREKLLYPPERNPIAVLQLSTMRISAAFSHPALAAGLPRDTRRRARRANGNPFADWVFSLRSSIRGLSWSSTIAFLAEASSAQSATFFRSLSARLRAAVYKYRYRRQRPRTRPWLSIACRFLCELDLSDRWEEARSIPTPELLAKSLSHLNAMTQSTEVFNAILVALGDIAIGKEVVPLVSADLKSRLSTEIRHNWRKADLVTLSRFMLVDQRLSDRPLIPSYALRERTPSVRSESVIFAFVESNGNRPVGGDWLDGYFPEVVVQPRALRYLLPALTEAFDSNFIILLALRYWDHLKEDPQVDIEGAVRHCVRYEIKIWRKRYDYLLAECPRAGLLEFLVCIVRSNTRASSVAIPGCALILKILSQPRRRERPCLVYAFGGHYSRKGDAIWGALSKYCMPPSHAYFDLVNALPLGWFLSLTLTSPAAVARSRMFQRCLADTIVRFLSPSRYFTPTLKWVPENMPCATKSTLELSIRCLHIHLCHRLSALKDGDKLDIITLMLRESMLVQATRPTRDDTFHQLWHPTPSSDQHVVNILTAVARQIAALLSSGKAKDFDTGAELFCLYSFSKTTGWDGVPAIWDLGAYLRETTSLDQRKWRMRLDNATLAPGHPTTPETMVLCLRRLLHVIRALRPFCMTRDDLRAAWDRINFPEIDGYSVSIRAASNLRRSAHLPRQDSFWHDENFELSVGLAPDTLSAAAEGDEAPHLQETTVQVVPADTLPLLYLEASMR